MACNIVTRPSWHVCCVINISCRSCWSFFYEIPSDPLEDWKFPLTRYVYWPLAITDRFYTTAAVATGSLLRKLQNAWFFALVLFANYSLGDIAYKLPLYRPQTIFPLRFIVNYEHVYEKMGYWFWRRSISKFFCF